jgi:hypothetical protein
LRSETICLRFRLAPCRPAVQGPARPSVKSRPTARPILASASACHTHLTSGKPLLFPVGEPPQCFNSRPSIRLECRRPPEPYRRSLGIMFAGSPSWLTARIRLEGRMNSARNIRLPVTSRRSGGLALPYPASNLRAPSPLQPHLLTSPACSVRREHARSSWIPRLPPSLPVPLPHASHPHSPTSANAPLAPPAP